MRPIGVLALALRSSPIYVMRSGSVLVTPSPRLVPGRICLVPPAAPTSSALGRGGKDGLLGSRQHQLGGLVHTLLDLRTGRSDVASASERSAQGGGIHPTTAANADFGEVARDFLEKDRQLEARDAV